MRRIPGASPPANARRPTSQLRTPNLTFPAIRQPLSSLLPAMNGAEEAGSPRIPDSSQKSRSMSLTPPAPSVSEKKGPGTEVMTTCRAQNVDDIIELLDSDDDSNDVEERGGGIQPVGTAASSQPTLPSQNAAALQHRALNIPGSMSTTAVAIDLREKQRIAAAAFQARVQLQQQQVQAASAGIAQNTAWEKYTWDEVKSSGPINFEIPEEHIPTWSQPIPVPPPTPQVAVQSNSKQRPRAFKLSLISCSEFTITAIPHPQNWDYSGESVNLRGLRIHIKKIAREEGEGAKFERGEGGGRWCIPLGAYQNILSFLINSDPRTYVDGITEDQLKIATLGKERLSRRYPSKDDLVKRGVPAGIASALAPYQRGGVDFVVDKNRNGRALIADEMGLGKTIQSIAAMAVYEREWPLVVFCPSSARYHWEAELRHWLGEESPVNNANEPYDNESMSSSIASENTGDTKRDEDGVISSSGRLISQSPSKDVPKPMMNFLRGRDINVLTSSKDRILEHHTRIVVCSYGLAPILINGGIVTPGMFQCAIVDESHMLKNKNTKRTQSILPIIAAARRCILLSGTPALARPVELWPQLSVLGRHKGWWIDEADYVNKYVRKDGETAAGDESSLAELHTLLTSTVMIRRMKADMLKNLPSKERQSATVRVRDEGLKIEFVRLMDLLRKGKGTLGKLARSQKGDSDVNQRKNGGGEGHGEFTGDIASSDRISRKSENTILLETARAALQQESRSRMQSRILQYRQDNLVPGTTINPDMRDRALQTFVRQASIQFERQLAADLSSLVPGGSYNGLKIIEHDEESSKKNVLNMLYTLTGTAKVPVLVEMLLKWLSDPSKGKLCIFAHHLDILNALSDGAGLSNSASSTTKFIRIDGSTSPKARQEEMRRFQTDPTVRIAILGITAAGVAVTLTAASTVWFAELFWTPAIMIQAEDRCHRIGQQARVRCLYLIAKGTLDEVLWKLLEQKFRDLGEFVEGKENLDIVVHRRFDCGLDAIQSGEGDHDTDEDDDHQSSSVKNAKRRRAECFGDLAEEADIQHDIEELAREEAVMLMDGLDRDGGEEDASGVASSSGTNTETSRCGKKNESSTICLLDDDDEEMDNKNKGVDKKTEQPIYITDAIETFIKENSMHYHFESRSRLKSLRTYNVCFGGRAYGMKLSPFDGHIIVVENCPARLRELGDGTKPGIGSIVLKINGVYLRYGVSFHEVKNYLVQLMHQSRIHGNPVEILFGEDDDFCKFIREVYLPKDTERKKQDALQRSVNNPDRQGVPTTRSADSVAATGVIEID